MTINTNDPAGENCSGCELVIGRRTFLRTAGLAAAGALVALGAPYSAALAITPRELKPSRARGAERSYRIPAMDSVSVDSQSKVILARLQNRMYAFSLACPHRGATLEWHSDEARVFCPKHKARFRADGAHDSGRQSRDLDRFDIRRNGDNIVINLDALRRADTDAKAWTSAFVQLT